MNETLRWFPPVVNIPKKSAEDTSFTITNAAGEKRTIPVPRDSVIIITTPSLHNNCTVPLLALPPLAPR